MASVSIYGLSNLIAVIESDNAAVAWEASRAYVRRLASANAESDRELWDRTANRHVYMRGSFRAVTTIALDTNPRKQASTFLASGI